MTRRTITAARDYAPLIAGAWGTTASRLPDVLRAVSTTRGSCPVAPNFGNRGGLTPGKITPTTPRVVENDIRDAVKHLTEDGLIWGLVVTCSVVNAGSALETVIEFEDASGPQSVIV